MISKILLIILILINLYKTNGCFRPFVTYHSSLNNTAKLSSHLYTSIFKNSNLTLRDLNDDYILSKSNWSSSLSTFDLKNKILIDSIKTCNKSEAFQTNSKTKKIYLYCYHSGKCKTIYKEINSTHYERHSYCICQKNYGGEDCRADDSFLEANVSIILIVVIAGVCISGFILFYVYFKKQRSSNTRNKYLNRDSTNSMSLLSQANNRLSSAANTSHNNNTDLIRGFKSPNGQTEILFDSYLSDPLNSETGLLLFKSDTNNGKTPIYRQVSSLSNKTGEIISNLNILRKATQ